MGSESVRGGLKRRGLRARPREYVLHQMTTGSRQEAKLVLCYLVTPSVDTQCSRLCTPYCTYISMEQAAEEQVVASRWIDWRRAAEGAPLAPPVAAADAARASNSKQ